MIVDEPWQIGSFIILNYAIDRTLYRIENEITVDHVVFNRNRYKIRCEQQNWLFLLFLKFYLSSPEHHITMYLSTYGWEKESSLQWWDWRSPIIWTLLSFYIWVLVEKETELERWSMTCECVYTLKLNVCIRQCLFFSFSSSSSSLFFLLDNQLIMINDSKRCWSIKKVVGHTNNIIRNTCTI